MVRVKCNGTLLRIYHKESEEALHALCARSGQYITREEHKPPEKQYKSAAHYRSKMEATGADTTAFFEALCHCRPRHWYDLARGVLSPGKSYEAAQINAACRRALSYQAFSYREVRDILRQGLHLEEEADPGPEGLGGYGQALAADDQLS